MKSQNITDSNIKRFNESAQTWDDEPRRVLMAQKVAAAIKNDISITNRMEALEFGCGTGLVTMGLAPFLKSITAVDTSEQMLDVLKQKIQKNSTENIFPLQTDVLKDGLPNNLYDLIYCSMTLHHIHETDSLIKLFSEHLKAGGFLAIADLAKEDGSFHDDNAGVAHHGFTYSELETLFEKNGLSNIKAVTVHTIKKEKDSGEIKEYPVFLIQGKKV